MFLVKGSMEISMYPVILRLTHKFFTERVHENAVYAVTSRLIQKFVTERVHKNFHVSCHIEFNLKKNSTKRVYGNLVVPLTEMQFFWNGPWICRCS